MTDKMMIVSVEDPALDRARMDVRKYAETRDPGLIVERPGMRAARWTIRDLTKRESDICDEQTHIVRKYNLAIAFALLEVELGSEKLVPTTAVPDRTGGSRPIWDDEAIAELQRRTSKLVLREIAHVICERDERVGEAFGGGALRYTLLPSSLGALDRIERQHAADLRSAPPTPPSDQSSPG